MSDEGRMKDEGAKCEFSTFTLNPSHSLESTYGK